ncbi:hypothetical protein Vretimale_12785 [Volvox reticuliferus]|uniref:Uncharacterized protein n=1 Tax=Volvox reticuliferus TaxID=1737510 RepID=A0A8J4CGA3_9CHLO|nr:hypothetical protein Vretifemale_10204 [Volvox reticuliferus]GIM08821.1 hypothetical protein Vretimale_12785 [Volvox reticuliferus]
MSAATPRRAANGWVRQQRGDFSPCIAPRMHVMSKNKVMHLESGSSDSQTPRAIAAGSSGCDSGPPPWALMGRMVPADSIALTTDQKQVLITSAAARLSGLDTDAFDAQLQELLLLLPDMRSRLLSLKPSILVELCGDTRAVAYKLIQLREMFPDANVSIIIAKRPTLLTSAEWPGVEAAHRKLQELFPEGGLGQMVTQQPLLLVEEVDQLVAELGRLMPGVDVRIMLLRNPGVVTQVQRGPGSLGPGAEFLGNADWL